MRLHDTELSKFEGKDLWVQVHYQGFYTSNYEYIQVVAFYDDDRDRMLFKQLSVAEVNALTSAAESLVTSDMRAWGIDLDAIQHKILGAPRSTLTYMYHVCHPIDAFTTEELLAAIEDLGGIQQ